MQGIEYLVKDGELLLKMDARQKKTDADISGKIDIHAENDPDMISKLLFTLQEEKDYLINMKTKDLEDMIFSDLIKNAQSEKMQSFLCCL